jgi:ElaB/YqjD/DUF883 family membrane-anchored ribosome-binding protein
MIAISWIAAASIAGATAPTTEDRAGASPFLRELPDVATLMAGEHVDFRYRRLEFDDEDDVPDRVLEGITRVELRATGVYTSDLHLEDRTADRDFGAAFLERTFHSFLTGEYARATRLAGAGSDQVVLERWAGFPKLTYYGLGLLGTSAMLSQLRPHGVRVLADGLEEYEYTLDDVGKVVTLLVDPAPPGRLVRAESRSSDDSWTEVIHFEGHVAGVAGLPDRPTRIVDARVSREGRVQAVTVWQAIERTDATAADDEVVMANSLVSNLRLPDSPYRDQASDRRTRLEDLLTSAAAAVEPQQFDVLTLDQTALAAMSRTESRAEGPFRRIGIVAAIGMIGAAFFLRKRGV